MLFDRTCSQAHAIYNCNSRILLGKATSSGEASCTLRPVPCGLCCGAWTKSSKCIFVQGRSHAPKKLSPVALTGCRNQVQTMMNSSIRVYKHKSILYPQVAQLFALHVILRFQQQFKDYDDNGLPLFFPWI